MEPSHEDAQKPQELRKQEPTDGKACTAYALVNALRLNGTPASMQDEDALIKSVQEGKSLETGDRKEILQRLGISYKPLSEALLENQQPEALLSVLENELSQSPVVFAVSRFLAKRPEAFREGKDNFHAVTAHMKSGKIEVVDPYAPEAPEVFDTQLPNDRQRLLSWFISPYIQHVGANTSDALTENTSNALSDDKSFGTAVRGVASLYQTYSLAKPSK